MVKLVVTLGILAVLYAALVLVAYVFQRQLIYFPTRYAEADLLREAAASGLQPWRNSKNELIGWIARHPQPPIKARIIVFHGNANHAHWCEYYAKAFQSYRQPYRWDVHLFEYPGYASRPGHPSESAIVEAALEAVDQLKSEGNEPIYLLGESIGSGAAAQVAARRPDDIAGMFFVAPLNNLPDVAASHMPLLPVRWLLKDTYRSDEALTKIHCPIGVLIGGKDEVIPNELSKKLYDGYTGPKKLWQQPFASHNTFNFDEDQPFWKEVTEFLLQKPAKATELVPPGAQP